MLGSYENKPTYTENHNKNISADPVLDAARHRLAVIGITFLLLFMTIGVKLTKLMVFDAHEEPKVASTERMNAFSPSRSNIYDRNKVLLATSIRAVSLYADPKDVTDPVQSAKTLQPFLPHLSAEYLIERLTKKCRFIWLQKNLTPKQHYEINSLGIPGLYFRTHERRVYPQSKLASHLVGFVNGEGEGAMGIEQSHNTFLQSNQGDLNLSIDTRVNYVLDDVLKKTIAEYSAKSGGAVMMDVESGEVVGMSSYPTFDPNNLDTKDEEALFARNTLGVYEFGSSFKLFTVANALENKAVTLRSRYDARTPIRVARFSINDYRGQNRWMSVPEILMYSSNIGCAKMALDTGIKQQQDFFKKIGFYDKTPVELLENAKPMLPNPWREVNAITASYGHGIAVTSLHMVAAVAPLVADGYYVEPTVLKRDASLSPRTQVISKKTSQTVRDLMRLVVTDGYGRKAAVKGYSVLGKTGTAELIRNGRYSKKLNRTSFLGAFPGNKPKYALFVYIDEPKGTKKTFGFATGGWIAAPTAKAIIERTAPLLGIQKQPDIASPIREATYIKWRK